ncbi:type III-A CRISPR-associated protein Csm2 [bacterium]|nr:type III-A CRISPR-associated protein Csm2 [bacterium]
MRVIIPDEILNFINMINEDCWSKSDIYQNMKTIAKIISQEKQRIYNEKKDKEEKPEKKKNSSTQLRKIFNQVMNLLRKSEKNPELEPMVEIYKARINYAAARNTIDEDLRLIFIKILDTIKDTWEQNKEKTDYDTIRKFVEAFYAYSYMELRKKEGKYIGSEN